MLIFRTHFDASEHLRRDTFNTVEALKSEFDNLRDELIIAEKSGVKMLSSEKKDRYDRYEGSKFNI